MTKQISLYFVSVADIASTLNATALVWISETWIRKVDKTGNSPIRNMPIIGERLHITVADNSGNRIHTGWTIERSSKDSQPILKKDLDHDESENDAHLFFLAPVLRAMGLKV